MIKSCRGGHVQQRTKKLLAGIADGRRQQQDYSIVKRLPFKNRNLLPIFIYSVILNFFYLEIKTTEELEGAYERESW